MSGPFKNMRYVRRAHGSEWPPKLLGTYEAELTPVIEHVLQGNYDRFIIVGAGEGYYAAGLALRRCGPEIIAFESSRKSRKLFHMLLAENGLEGRVSVGDRCSCETLASALKGAARTFVICDVEGEEIDLLDFSKVPGLRFADVLVELHDFARPGVERCTRAQFAMSHNIQSIESIARAPSDGPIGLGFSDAELRLLLSEERPGPMTWLWLTSRFTSP